MRISIAVLAALLAGCTGNDGSFSSAPPSLHVGEVALSAGQPQIAIGVADTQLSLNSGNAEALLLRARGYAAQGRMFEAEADYRRALLDRSTSNEAAIGLSRILTGTNPAAAASLLAEVTINGNANAGVWNNLGVARDLQDRHAEAQTAYRKALQADPAMMSARTNLNRSLAMTPATQTFAMASEPAPAHEALSLASASEPTPAAPAPESRPLVVAADARPVLPAPATPPASAPETRHVAVADDAPATPPASAPEARPLAVATAAPVPALETHPVAVAREVAKPQVLPAIALATVAAPTVSATASCSTSGGAPLPVVSASFVDSLLHPYRQAMEAAEADVRCDPSNLEFRRRLMDIALQSGDDEKAGALAKMTVQQAPNDPRGYVMTAAVERFRGNFREGLESLRKAKTLLNTVATSADPGNAKTRLD